MADYHQLTTRVINDLVDAGYDPEVLVEDCSERELLDIWLQWNGICGFTYDIIGAIDSIRNAKGVAS